MMRRRESMRPPSRVLSPLGRSAVDKWVASLHSYQSSQGPKKPSVGPSPTNPSRITSLAQHLSFLTASPLSLQLLARRRNGRRRRSNLRRCLAADSRKRGERSRGGDPVAAEAAGAFLLWPLFPHLPLLREIFKSAMPGESHLLEAGGIPKKRKSGHKKGRKAKKKVNVFPGAGEKIKIDNRMRKLFRKRAREYNSDDDEDEEVAASKDDDAVPLTDDKKNVESHGLDDDEPEVSDDEHEEEDDEVHPGIIKFTEGVRAFRKAFQSIIKKSVSDDSLGPVMSAHKKLVAEKLAEEETERKVKGEAKKEKHLVGEKGHLKPANYLDAHDKFLISVATKGVVKLFNAVNKAQNAQKGLDASRSKDAKAIKKRRKEAFFSELSKPSFSSAKTPAKVHMSTSAGDGEPPAWAPLRDNYMLTNSKLKDWDKMQESSEPEDFRRRSEDSSSDDD